MHLFTADQFTGEITDCDEGELVWVPKKEIKDLKLWEGDKIFLRLLDECEEYFSLKLVYEGDTLVDKKLIIAGKEQKAERQAGYKGEKHDNKNLPGRHPACL